MQFDLVQADIHRREEALSRCRSNLYALRTASKKNPAEIRLVEQQIFFLQDQLNQLDTVAAILKDDQVTHDEMLPKV